MVRQRLLHYKGNGFAGEDAARVTFPSIVGHLKYYDPRVGKSCLHCFIGDDA